MAARSCGATIRCWRNRRCATDRAGHGACDLPELPALHSDHAACRAVELCAATGGRAGRAGLERLCRFQGLRASAPGDGALMPEDSAKPRRLLVRGGEVYDHDGDVHKPKTQTSSSRRRHRRRRCAARRRRCGGDRRARQARHPRPHQRALPFPRHALPRPVRGAAAGNVAALHAAAGRQPQPRGGEGAHARRRAGIDPLRHHLRAGHAGADPARRRQHRRRHRCLSRDRAARGVLAHGLGRAADRDGAPQGRPAGRRAGDARHHRPSDPRPARLSRAPVQPASRRRHAALGAGAVCAAALHARDAAGLRRACRTSTTCRSTPTSTRPAARC